MMGAGLGNIYELLCNADMFGGTHRKNRTLSKGIFTLKNLANDCT